MSLDVILVLSGSLSLYSVSEFLPLMLRIFLLQHSRTRIGDKAYNIL